MPSFKSYSGGSFFGFGASMLKNKFYRSKKQPPGTTLTRVHPSDYHTIKNRKKSQLFMRRLAQANVAASTGELGFSISSWFWTFWRRGKKGFMDSVKYKHKFEGPRDDSVTLREIWTMVDEIKKRGVGPCTNCPFGRPTTSLTPPTGKTNSESAPQGGGGGSADVGGDTGGGNGGGD